MKKCLFIDDLLKNINDIFSENNNSLCFSSTKKGYELAVGIHGKLLFEEEGKTDEGLLPVHLQACHTGKNLNNSFIEYKDMERNINSIFNRPILGYIHVVDGEYEFYQHNMHLDEDDEIVYDEIPVGVIPESCNAELVYDEDKEKNYLEVDGYIYEEYTKAAEILLRHGECPVSVELTIRDMEYDSDNDVLKIIDFYFSGVTILGKDEDGNVVKEGMEGSNIKLAKDVDKEDETSDVNNNFSKEVKTMFDSDENAVDETTKVVEQDDETTIDENVDEVVDEDSDTVADEDNVDIDDTDDTENDDAVGTVGLGLSLDEIKNRVQLRLDSMHDDNEPWRYVVAIYDNLVVYTLGWDGSIYYAQKYTSDNTDVEFIGEPYRVYAQFLTKEEIDSLEEIKSSYDEISKELEECKANAKNDVFEDEAYADYLENEEFKNLMSKESFAKYSAKELKEKADAILGRILSKEKNAEKKDVSQFSVAFSSRDTNVTFLDELLNKTKK